jgi:hypothetical protein
MRAWWALAPAGRTTAPQNRCAARWHIGCTTAKDAGAQTPDRCRDLRCLWLTERCVLPERPGTSWSFQACGGHERCFCYEQESTVQHHPSPSAQPENNDSEPTEAPALPWQVEVGRLLTQAAALCVEQNVDVDAFMKGAWSAYVEARPGMRDYLEEMQLRDQLEEIRKLGRMGQA